MKKSHLVAIFSPSFGLSATTEFLVQNFVIVTTTRVYVGIVIVQEEIFLTLEIPVYEPLFRGSARFADVRDIFR